MTPLEKHNISLIDDIKKLVGANAQLHSDLKEVRNLNLELSKALVFEMGTNEALRDIIKKLEDSK